MKTFLSWSGGKDSSMCLYKAGQQGLQINALVTSVNQVHDRISMHGVRRSLLEQQAKALGLPLYTVELPEQPDMQQYEAEISKTWQQLKREQYTKAVFGDIFLEDLKQYREQQLAKEGLEGVFPLWKLDSRDLMNEFIAAGFKAIIVCVNNQMLPQSFFGRLLDENFVRDCPEGVDICGENGEYHSFVFDGPIFNYPVSFTIGETVYREYKAPTDEKDECFTTPRPPAAFSFLDLLPV